MKAEEKNKIEKFMDSRGWLWGDIFNWDDVRGLISEYAATHQEGAKLRKLADIIREAWTPDSELADKKGLKLYKVDFDGVWPVPCALVILAENEEAARHFAQITITHTTFFKVKEAPMIEGVVVYESGDY